MNLIAISAISKKYGFSVAELKSAFKKAGIKHVAEHPQGRGSAYFFNEDDAKVAVSALEERDERRAKAKLAVEAKSKAKLDMVAAEASGVASAAPADIAPIVRAVGAQTGAIERQTAAVGALSTRVKVLEDALSLQASELSEVREALAKVIAINESVLSTVNFVHKAIGARLDSIGATKVSDDVIVAPVKAGKVAIVGLIESQAQMILREFSDRFDIRWFDSQSAGNAGFSTRLKDMDAILVVTSFVSHKAEIAARNSGAPCIRVNGGMTSVRDELQRLYAERVKKVQH